MNFTGSCRKFEPVRTCRPSWSPAILASIVTGTTSGTVK